MTTARVLDLTPKLEAHKYEVEHPSSALPDPAALFGPVDFDTETSGLFPDDNARVCAVGVAYRLRDDPDTIWYHAFPFDQGRAQDKGFQIVHYLDTPLNRKRGVAGLPKGDPHGQWDWDTDYNLPRDEWLVFCYWLRDAGKRNGLVNQNIAFDTRMMRAGTRHWKGVELEKYIRWDPMLASPRLWPYANSNALKPVAARVWGEDEVQEAQVVRDALIETKKRYGLKAEHGKRYDLLPWRGVNEEYVAQDAVLSLRLGELQEDMIAEGWASGAGVDREVLMSRVIARMERRGLGPYDVQASREVADRIDAKIAQLAVSLPFQPHTGPRAATYFYDELGMTPWNDIEQHRLVEVLPDMRKNAKPGVMVRKVTQQGDLSARVARRMATADVPHADTWAQITELSIANKMFYRNYADRAGPDSQLRAGFKQSHVRSGRLSVERLQLHALPKQVKYELDGQPLPQPRSFFGAPPGKVRMNLDLGQAELRIASLLAGCTVMLNDLLTGADFHSRTTKSIFDNMHEEHSEWKLYRDIGKRATFASLFMVGPAKFQLTLWDEAELYWPLERCKRTIYAWRNLYPEFGAAYYEWMEFAEKHRYVPRIDGSISWMAQPRDYPNSAWNRRVQSSLALFVCDWLTMIERETAKYDALELTVHDSAQLLLPEDIADDVCAKLAVVTEQMWEDFFGIPGKCDVGPWYQ